MLKKLFSYSFLLVVLCIVLALPTLAQTKIGAEVQTWTYDPTHNPPLVTVKIVNNSHQDITAFNISIKETYANGHVEKHEVLEEFLGKIIVSKERPGNANDDGTLHAGAVWDEKLPVQAELTDYQAVLDVVTYMDGTADSTNDDALGRIVQERQASLASQKIAVEIIKTALASNDTSPSLTAAKKIRDRLTMWKAEEHTKLDLDTARLDSIANELISRQGAATEILAREEARIAIMSVHARPAKVGGSQWNGLLF